MEKLHSINSLGMKKTVKRQENTLKYLRERQLFVEKYSINETDLKGRHRKKTE